MKKIFLFFLSLLLISSLSSLVYAQSLDGGTGGQATTQKGTVVQIGDSLTEGMAQYGGLLDKYTTAGWTPVVPGNPSAYVDGNFCSGATNGYPCHALATGASPNGLEAIDQNASSIKTASVIVMEMGTNTGESDFGAAVNQAVTKIHQINPTIKIYWVNMAAKTNTAEYSKRNKALSDIAATGSITIIDWFHKMFPTSDPANMTDAMPEPNGWLNTSDNVHLTIPTGYKAMADFVATSVTSGGSTTTGNTTSSSSSSVYTSECFVVKVGNPLGTPPACPSINMQTTTHVTGDGTHPVAPAVPDGDYRKAIHDKFGVTVGLGFNPPNEDYNPYKVIWEKLWDVSNTNFINYLKIANAEIQPIGGGSITTHNIANVRSNVEDAELFRVIFIHELGHVIRNMLPVDISHRADAINVLDTEGGLTAYSDNPSCRYEGYADPGVRQDEDYAEMTTFYLNPGVTDRTNCTQGVVPFASGAHPLHYALAQQIYGKY
jgi:lysophospholipase L1-like esterase